MLYRVTVGTIPKTSTFPKGAHRKSERTATFFRDAASASAWFRHCCSIKRDNQSVLMDRTETPDEERRALLVDDARGLLMTGDPVWWKEVAGAPFGPMPDGQLWHVLDIEHFHGPDGRTEQERILMRMQGVEV